jgi:uncharacterized membrane protein
MEHMITEGLPDEWPHLLGYQLVESKETAQTLAVVDDDPLLVVGCHGKGRCVAYMTDIGPHW